MASQIQAVVRSSVTLSFVVVLAAGCLDGKTDEGGSGMEDVGRPVEWELLHVDSRVAPGEPNGDAVTARFLASKRSLLESWPRASAAPDVDFGEAAVVLFTVSNATLDITDMAYTARVGYSAKVNVTTPGDRCDAGGAVAEFRAWVKVDRRGTVTAATPVDVDVVSTALPSCAHLNRPLRQFHVLSVLGSYWREPTPPDRTGACDQPLGSRGTWHWDDRVLSMEQNPDPRLPPPNHFDWLSTDLVVWENLIDWDERAGCDATLFARLLARDDTYSFSVGSQTYQAALTPDGIVIDDTLMHAGESREIEINRTEGGTRLRGHIDIQYGGAWEVQDILIVPPDSMPRGAWWES